MLTKLLVQLFALTLLFSLYKAHISTLQSFTVCEKPDPPFAKNPKVNVSLETYNVNGSLNVRGTFVLKDNVTGLMTFRADLEKNGNITRNIVNYKGLTCNSLLVKATYRAINLKADYRACIGYKGTYRFERLDINKLYHMLNYIPARAQEMGMHVWYVGLYDKFGSGTFFCANIRVEMKEDVKKKTKKN